MKLNQILLLALVAVAAVESRPSAQDGQRLIKVSEAEPAKWVSEDGINELIRNKVHFIDITDHQAQIVKDKPVNGGTKAFPTQLKFQTVVQEIFTKLSIPRMTEFITEFSGFFNRYYNSDNGQDSSEWLLQQVQNSISAGYAGKASVAPFAHTWKQASVIARIEGSDPTLKNEVVVLGAHQDSLNLNNPSGGAAPGADDDASGSVVLLETFRALIESGFVPKRTLEFQWYAAEEVGLRGSQAIAQSYYNEGVNVVSMAQFDVVGYYDGLKEVGIITDYTDSGLNAFLRLVIDEYLDYKWTNLECGYGCSDHVSWTQLDYPAAFPVEIEFHPYMHTTRDTVDLVNFEQVLEFTKLAVGYAIEISEQ